MLTTSYFDNYYAPALWFFWHDGHRVYNPYLSEDRKRVVDPCEYYGFQADPGGEDILTKDFGDVLVWLGTGTHPADSLRIPSPADAAQNQVWLGSWGASRDGRARQFVAHGLPSESDILEFEEFFKDVLPTLDANHGLENAYLRLLQFRINLKSTSASTS
jgi:hypothetical protein